jgi:hypothetical protein
VVERYAAAGAHPVRVDRDRLRALGVWLAEADLAGGVMLARHRPDKLGRAVLRLLRQGGPRSRRAAAAPGRRERVLTRGPAASGPAS